MPSKKLTAVDLICSLFILLFTYAALSKLLGFQKFQVQLGQSPLLSPFSYIVAIMIPLSELIIAVALGTFQFRLLGLYSSFFLMVLFTAYIFILTRYSNEVPCSCGGVLQEMTWNQHLLFNAAFAALAFAGVLLFKPDIDMSKRQNELLQ